jgi:type IV pilus assembly protein PilC
MSHLLTYQPRIAAQAAGPDGPLRLILRVAGPFAWGFAALFVIALGGFVVGLLFNVVLGVVAAWLWILFLLIAALVTVRTLRNVRKTRGALLLAWLDAAVRLNLPLHNFLLAAAAGETGRLKKRLQRLALDLSSGVSVGQILARQVPEVPPRLAAQIAAAERIGQLAPTLHRLTERPRLQPSAPRKASHLFRGLYPVVVLLTTCYLVTFFMIFVVPKFREIFKDFGVPLPTITQYVLAISDWIANEYGWLLILPLLFAFFALLARALREIFTPWWPRTTPAWLVEAFAWYVPLASRLARSRGYADLCQFLADALRAGLPFHHALSDASQVATNRFFAQDILDWRAATLAGQSPGTAARHAGMPRLLAGFLDAGTGDTPEAFAFLARYYRARHTRFAALLSDALEPAVTLLVALLVGLVAFSLFKPLVVLIDAVMQPEWGTGAAGRGVL